MTLRWTGTTASCRLHEVQTLANQQYELKSAFGMASPREDELRSSGKWAVLQPLNGVPDCFSRSQDVGIVQMCVTSGRAICRCPSNPPINGNVSDSAAALGGRFLPWISWLQGARGLIVARLACLVAAVSQLPFFLSSILGTVESPTGTRLPTEKTSENSVSARAKLWVPQGASCSLAKIDASRFPLHAPTREPRYGHVAKP